MAQMQKAIDWANSILDNPIHLTERSDNETLLRRIKGILQDDESALKAFMSLTMHGEDTNLGAFIRKHFQSETIRTYFFKQFRHYNIGQVGFNIDLSRFFNLGFSIEEACGICVLDDDGCRYDPQSFAEEVMSMEWDAEENSDNIPLTLNDPESDEPETVDAQFGKTFLRATGFQEPMKSNLSYNDVSTALERKLGSLIDMTAIFQEEQDKQVKSDSLLDELFARINENTGEDSAPKKRYTIESLEDLLRWSEGDSVHPNIEEGIKRIKETIAKDLENTKRKYEHFHEHPNDAKIRMLINANDYFLIRDDSWQHFFEHLERVDLMNSVIGILTIKADEVTINKYCKALMNNMNLLERYIL